MNDAGTPATGAMSNTAIAMAVSIAAIGFFVVQFAAVDSSFAQHEPAVGGETGIHGGASSEEAERHGEHHGLLGPNYSFWERVQPVLKNTEFQGSVFNFGLLLVLIVYFGRKPIRRFLVSRRREIEDNLAEAQRLKAEAEAKANAYALRLERLDAELEQLRADMVKAGEADRERIVVEAEAKAARMRKETQFLIDQRMKQLREDLQRFAVDAAIEAAGRVLQQETTSTDQQRLADAYVKRLVELTGVTPTNSMIPPDGEASS